MSILSFTTGKILLVSFDQHYFTLFAFEKKKMLQRNILSIEVKETFFIHSFICFGNKFEKKIKCCSICTVFRDNLDSIDSKPCWCFASVELLLIIIKLLLSSIVFIAETERIQAINKTMKKKKKKKKKKNVHLFHYYTAAHIQMHKNKNPFFNIKKKKKKEKKKWGRDLFCSS